MNLKFYNLNRPLDRKVENLHNFWEQNSKHLASPSLFSISLFFSPVFNFSARDLIRGFLVKEPQHRLAYKRGSTEIKQHSFFEEVNWALIRSASPPEIPKPV
jgi:hypothetical protein